MLMERKGTMIVYRLTGPVKLGRTQQMVDLLKSFRATFPNPRAVRIYSSHPAGAPGYNVVMDIEFQSLTALEQWLGEWFAKPDTATFLAKMEALEEPGGDSTIWVLEE
jgi:hypothetical protein